MKIKYLRYISIPFWILIWQLVSLAVGRPLLLPSPLESGKALIELMGTGGFWEAVYGSFIRITLGFLLALIIGIMFAVVAHRSILLRELITPLIRLVKAVPVASFIILALLWIQSSVLPLMISFLMVLPVIYINVLQGIGSTNRKLLEMAGVFNLNRRRKLRYIYIPAVMPYFISACSIGLGLCWKSGVAAEIIGLSPDSIGRQLYDAKLYFMTKELFAWTAVIVLISSGFERLVMYAVSKGSKRLIGGRTNKSNKIESGYMETGSINDKAIAIDYGGANIELKHITKSYDGFTVLSDWNMTLQAGKITCLMGASGVGKTTVMNLLLGLQQPDEGMISGLEHASLSAVFQEDRLCDLFCAIDNVRLINKNLTVQEIKREFEEVGLADYEDKPISALSGGMKRRVAIVRAMMAKSSLLLMDEPFQGLDEELKEKIVQYVAKRAVGKTIFLITHDRKEADLLGDKTIIMEKRA